MYNVAASKSIATTVEFKECMQLLGFQSRNELVVKFERVLTILEEHLNNNRENEFVEEYFKEISEFLANVCVDSMEEDELSDEAPVEDLQNMNRQQLKQVYCKFWLTRIINCNDLIIEIIYDVEEI